MTWSARTGRPPNVDFHPGLKSNRSLIAVGTPCSGPSWSPDDDSLLGVGRRPTSVVVALEDERR